MAKLYSNLILICTLISLLGPEVASLHINEYVFGDQYTTTKLIVDSVTGKVFVGGKNILASFDSQLQLVENHSLGPTMDSEKCFAYPDNCTEAKQFLANTVRILLINPVHNYLFVCGTLFQGQCFIHELNNIRSITAVDPTKVTAFIGSEHQAFAYFGQPPNDYSNDRLMLYVAMPTYDRTSDLFTPAVISTREITYNNTHASSQYMLDTLSLYDKSYIDSQDLVAKKFRVKYIYGFEYDGYGYYISIQPTDQDLARTKYITKIVEFCKNEDKSYRTYMETPISCTKDSFSYNLATSAYVSDVGFNVSGNQFLYVSFGRNMDDRSSVSDPSLGGTVCVYPLYDIRQHFKTVKSECYIRAEGTYPWWIVGVMGYSCQISLKFTPSTPCDYDSSQDRGIASKENYQLTKKAMVCTSSLVTSLVVTSQTNHPIAILGTHNGQILKASVKSSVCGNNLPYMKFDVNKGGQIQPIEQDMSMDSQQDHVYALTGNRVLMFPLKSCDVYSECDTCVSSHDPLGCGWCDDKCTKRDECNDPSKTWSHDTCKPIITSFTPQSGPVQGGTLLTIYGKNFGTKPTTVTIGDSTDQCIIGKKFNNTMITCTTYSSQVEGQFSVTVVAQDLSLTDLNYKVDGTVRTTHLKFEYKAPSLSRIFPLIGPKSGGTMVTLVGQNFDIGKSQDVFVGDLDCKEVSLNNTHILCETIPFKLRRRKKRSLWDGSSAYIILKIDNADLQSEARFVYATDSTITSISPITTIQSGGTRITVYGTNLHIVQTPKVGARVLSLQKDTELETCTSGENGAKMLCPTPNIKTLVSEIDPQTPLPVNLFFVMDGIEALAEFWVSKPTASRFFYYTDPIVYKFPGDEQLLQFDLSLNEELKINGQYLTLGLKAEQYSILIGRSHCNITSIKVSLIKCKPSDTSIQNQELPVVVYAGSFLKVDIGKIILFTPEGPGTKLDIGIISLIVIIILVIIAIIVLFIVMKRKRMGPFREKEEIMMRYRTSGEAPETGDPLLQNNRNQYQEQGEEAEVAGAGPVSSGLDETTRLLLQDQNLLISRESLRMGELLGQGHFGSVFKGYLTLEEEKGETLVAVKTLHKDSPREIDVQAFTKEALIMKDFNNPNVLSLIGICLGIDDMPLVVLPFIKHGDLLSYIRDDTHNPTIKDLINFAIDIAEGMAYLSSLKFVHRDLAARNCMLDEEYRVKVADFGLSRDIYEKDYYACDNKKTMLPVKWMAIESLEKGKYSTKSDVWSYGIVLWELLTRGVNPYPEVDNWDIVRYLKQGRRMPQPQYCPDPLYTIMRKCWMPNSHDRPTFADLVHEIRDMITMLEQAMGQGKDSANIQSTYVNMEKCTDYHYTDELMSPPDSESEPTSPASGPASPFRHSSTPSMEPYSTNLLSARGKGSSPPEPEPPAEGAVSDSKEQEETTPDTDTEKQNSPASKSEVAVKPNIKPKPRAISKEKLEVDDTNPTSNTSLLPDLPDKEVKVKQKPKLSPKPNRGDSTRESSA